MFKSLRAYKEIRWERDTLSCKVKELRDHTESLEKRLQDLESDIKEHKEAIQHKDNELETLRNNSNARLSVIVGMKRYLDTFFEKEKAPTSPTNFNKNPKE